MKQRYNIDWLLDRYGEPQSLKFLFFWGHTNKSNDEVGKYCFSQWFELPFIVDSITYLTSEHWMMATKAMLFNDMSTYKKIIEANKPGEVKELGRQVLGFDEQIWNNKRFGVVKSGNIHKFNQHPKFASFLIGTGDRILVEASPVDTVWGNGLSADSEYVTDPYCWRGLNLLGFALMEVRDFLREFGYFNNLEGAVSPPWKFYPNIDPLDMFWRMGEGEDVLTRFHKYYSSLSERDKTIFRLTNPEPGAWHERFYQ